MGRERRGFERFPLDIEATLTLCRDKKGETLCSPLACRLRDVSRKGAGLHCNRIIVDNRHLFFAPLEDSDLVLRLTIADHSAESETAYGVAARPVWFDRLIDDEGQPFAMGVEFVDLLPDALYRKLRASG